MNNLVEQATLQLADDLADENAKLKRIIIKASQYSFIPLNLHNYLVNELAKIENAGTTSSGDQAPSRVQRQR